MFQLDPDAYGPTCAPLLRGDTITSLGPGSPCHARRKELASLNLATLAGPRPVVDDQMAHCCIAGLWLLYDFLDESHTISQQISTPSGSYWHALMHRREPDYANAKYWFRRVGNHPIFDRLSAEAAALNQTPLIKSQAASGAQPPPWNALQFVDLCQAVAGRDALSESLCRNIAHVEWQLLFDYCFEQATNPH